MKKKWFGIVMILTMVFSFSTGAFAAETGGGGSEKDIVDTAAAAGDFKILAAALEKAGLVSTLKEAGPYTVFAPTDQAFEKLLKDLNITAEELLNREDLKDILLYHVLSGKVLSSDLKDGMKAKTLAGKEVTITLDPVKVNNSTVVKPDIEASNGVIHVIDTVLIRY
ncbi:fasciclin domain-containing protein [Metabacillus indicus]|uniref:fasciclin domain-containing protein n=1 Tax=Metabacillus indicus TaxID=246786 RepID=UPI003984493F